MTAILTDPHLRQCLADIVKQAKVSCIVETGTNDGTTTLELAKLVKTVITVELDENLYWQHHDKLCDAGNIVHNHASSDDFLERYLLGILIGGNRPPDTSMLLVLDAHWNTDWPLMKELIAINKQRRAGFKMTILIDDWISDQPQFAGCYGGLRSDDSKGREHLLVPCAYESFAAELDTFPHFYEPIYESGGIGYAIASDFELDLGEKFRRVR